MSIRTIQTIYRAQSPLSIEPTAWTLQPSSNVLSPLNLNHSRPSYVNQQEKILAFPPGLDQPVEPVVPRTRRRSGSFSYYPGNSYSSGNLESLQANNGAGFIALSKPAPSAPHRRPGPVSRVASARMPYDMISGKRSSPPPPPPSRALGNFPHERKSRFDPFGSETSDSCDPKISLTAPLTHHWQYDPYSNLPVKVYDTTSTPPPTTVRIEHPSTYTIQLPTVPQPPPVKRSTLADKEARSKLVAGILLNRVYAVGKPMRRRSSGGNESKGYVKSGLSSVVSVGA